MPHTIVILPNTNGMQLLLCYDSKYMVNLFSLKACKNILKAVIAILALTNEIMRKG